MSTFFPSLQVGNWTAVNINIKTSKRTNEKNDNNNQPKPTLALKACLKATFWLCPITVTGCPEECWSHHP